MEGKWLEDFIALAETRSFTRAADRCHSSQSALSRRIQALERWVGSPLVDRDAYPLELTEAGRRFLAVAVGLLGSVEAARQIVKTRSEVATSPIRVLMQPDLNPTLLAQMLAQVDDGTCNPLHTSLATASPQECFARLANDEADLLLLQQHPTLPIVVDPLRYQCMTVTHDTVQLCAHAGMRHHLNLEGYASQSGAVPMIEYTAATYLAQVVAMLLCRAGRTVSTRRVCEADSATAAVAMLRAGVGLAFVPASLVQEDLECGRLVTVGSQWQSRLEVLLVRETRSARRATLDHQRRALDGLWARMEALSAGGSQHLGSLSVAAHTHLHGASSRAAMSRTALSA